MRERLLVHQLITVNPTVEAVAKQTTMPVGKDRTISFVDRSRFAKTHVLQVRFMSWEYRGNPAGYEQICVLARRASNHILRRLVSLREDPCNGPVTTDSKEEARAFVIAAAKVQRQ